MYKILVVDDDEGVRWSLRMLLKDQYDLAFAQDGKAAIAMFSEVQPDIVLLDLCMPELSGIEVMRSFKTLDPHMVAIIITAFASVETAQKALRLGAFDYLIKPFNPTDLEDVIRSAVAHRVELLHLYLKAEAEQQRMQFLSYISHELKTPLTPMIGAVELLKNGDLGPLNAKQVQVLEMADRQSKRLHHLTNDLLDLFRLENGGMILHPEPASIPSLVAESISAYTPLYEEKGLYIRQELPLHLPAILVDKQRFGQILDNLLDNAYKYTESGGVLVTAASEGTMVRIGISDTGIGMTAEESEQIFRPFYQAQNTSRGAGLGLTIIKQLVEAHGGSIEVEGFGIGKGCRISVLLPVAPVRQQAAQPYSLAG